jgi:GT2 family glycosyltransferase/glycosyltransferase involved in cell wall biosynthesis
VKLLLAHQAYPPAGGGAEVYTEALARRLARAHEVLVLHPAREAGRPDLEISESRRDGVRLFALNNRRPDAEGFEAYRDARVTVALARLLDDLRPDLLHAGHLNGLSTGLVFEARRRGIPTVLTLHDFWPACPLGQLLNLQLEVCPGPTPRRCLGCVGEQVAAPPGTVPAAVRRVPFAAAAGRLLGRLRPAAAGRVERRLTEMHEVLRSVDLLIAPSRVVRDRLAAVDFPAAEVLPYGHAPLVVPPLRPSEDGRVRFGFLGAAIPSKGVHVLAEAFRLLDDPRASLQIHGAFVPYHGDTGYEARVRAILGPRADACLRGPFAHGRLGEILAGLDVVVVPSIWEENAPLVVEEAFLARRPLVVSDHGGLAERVRDGVDGLRFRPGDATDLSRALRRLLDEPSLRLALGARPPHVPTLDEHADALQGLYEKARLRMRERQGQVGVVIVDHGRPEDTALAVRSVLDDGDPQVVVVENGPGPDPVLPPGVTILRLPENRGYAGGVNAGIEVLRRSGCDRLLLLNNDAVLEPGALRRLAEALEDPWLAAVAPIVLREVDGRVESRGARFDARSGRQRLAGHGARFEPREGRVAAESLSGAAWMLSRAALDRVGPLDEGYFHSFEDVDWCARARAAGFGLAVVLGARARHAGGRTLGAASPDRLYYATRNHLRAVERLRPLEGPARALRSARVVLLNVAHALRQGDVPRLAAAAAVLVGTRDFYRGCVGPGLRVPRPIDGGRDSLPAKPHAGEAPGRGGVPSCGIPPRNGPG